MEAAPSHANAELLSRFYRAFAAPGAPGWLLGWTPALRKKVRAQAAANLKAFRGQG